MTLHTYLTYLQAGLSSLLPIIIEQNLIIAMLQMFSSLKLYAGVQTPKKYRRWYIMGFNNNESRSDNVHIHTQSSDNGGTTLSCFEPKS